MMYRGSCHCGAVVIEVEAPEMKLSLTQFLARQGLTGIAMRVDLGKVAAHPVSGKFRQVWREKPHHT